MARLLGSIPSNLTYLVLLSCCCTLSDLIDDSQSQYALVLGVDDGLQQPHWRERLKMPRSLLAALAVQCLLLREEGGWQHQMHMRIVASYPSVVVFTYIVRSSLQSTNQTVTVHPMPAHLMQGRIMSGCLLDAECLKGCITGLLVCVVHPLAGAANRSIDCAGLVVVDAAQATTATEQVKQLLQEMPDNCDYSINDRTLPDAVFV